MLPEKPLTPEKQLLKLIEEPHARDSLHIAAIKHNSLAWFSLPAWTGRMSFAKDWLAKWRKSPSRGIDVKTINTVLLAGAAVLGCYGIWNVLNHAINFKKMPEIKIEANEGAAIEGGREVSLLKNSLSSYLEKVRQRDIFRIEQKQQDAAADAPVKVSKSRITEMTQHLKLVGISWSSDPDAMIEDTRALKTFFVKVGQLIGDIKVQAIFKDKVVLMYSGEEIELK